MKLPTWMAIPIEDVLGNRLHAVSEGDKVYIYDAPRAFSSDADNLLGTYTVVEFCRLLMDGEQDPKTRVMRINTGE